MKTSVVNSKSIKHGWYVVDATDVVLGRLASQVASALIGKGKPAYSPNQDHGDHVIVVNSDKVRLTGNKAETKTYFKPSKYPSGAKRRSFKEQMAQDPAEVIKHAVWGMVPKTTLGRKIIKKLHVYKGESHPHTAQKPQQMEVRGPSSN